MSDTSVRHLILGAAGHVDHGKTALIKALTGVNTDRLKEEQERGISIELGFAEFDLGEGVLLGVVDMPGHERFVKQMVAGAGGVDLAFLVIAADEGVMPQTVEHLEILQTLGVRSGIVVISKIDLVDEDIVAVATAEAGDLVAGTFLEGKPALPVSALTGEGIAELKAALLAEALQLPPRSRAGFFRLPIDRVFTLPGAGTIVTGTCWSGAVMPGDHLVIEPVGRKVRVREVQAHGRPAGRGGSGQRLALALHGVKKEDVVRGYQVVTPDCCQVTRRLDLRVHLLPHYKGVLKNRQRLHVHHAGREVLGRLVLLDELELGGESGPRTGLGQFHLEEPLVPRSGDRLVLRFYSPVTTIAGGVILDGRPARHKRFDARCLAALTVREKGDPAALFRQALSAADLAGSPAADHPDFLDDPAAVRIGDRLYDREILTVRAAKVAELVADYARRFPLRLGISKEEARRKLRFSGGRAEWNALCQAMADLSGWVVVGDKIGPDRKGPDLSEPLAAAVQRGEMALRSYGLQWPGSTAFAQQLDPPPHPGAGPEEYLRHLVDHGHAVQIASDYYVHTDVLAEVSAAVKAHFSRRPELSFADFRELTGLTRKLGIPLLEHLDQTGETVRVGDMRRRGPALAQE